MSHIISRNLVEEVSDVTIISNRGNVSPYINKPAKAATSFIPDKQGTLNLRNG